MKHLALLQPTRAGVYVPVELPAERRRLLVLFVERIMQGMHSLASGAGITASRLLFFQVCHSSVDLMCGT